MQQASTIASVRVHHVVVVAERLVGLEQRELGL